MSWNVTPDQLRILHHTLGLRPDRRTPYRDHFVAGPGHSDMPDLEALEAAGLMERRRTPALCDQSDVVFGCTAAGQSYAVEHLPPEPKLTRYDEYLRSDTGHSFAEWLGIREPRIEFRGPFNACEYRMFRINGFYERDIYGDWAPTKKAAKESYKAALRASRVR